MVSKRQKEAKKKFKQENPGLFPKPEPTPPNDPTKKKKKKPDFKKSNPNHPKTLNNPRKSSFTRKLLRVPGLKPGDCCFICKDVHHIAKNCPEKAQWEKHKICLCCRQRGHSMKNCPNKNDEYVEAVGQKLCYNCGENGHSLSQCPQPLQDGGTKFALCFICNERGHLSKNCPKSTHGIYPKGGCCKICGGVTHLARDCPNKGSSYAGANRGGKVSILDQSRSQVTKLCSGDDLEDDFMIDDDNKVKNDFKKSESDPASEENHNHAKIKKKQGPKIVNFVG